MEKIAAQSVANYTEFSYSIIGDEICMWHGIEQARSRAREMIELARCSSSFATRAARQTHLIRSGFWWFDVGSRGEAVQQDNSIRHLPLAARGTGIFSEAFSRGAT